MKKPIRDVPEILLRGGPGSGGLGASACSPGSSPTARPSTMPYARPGEGGCGSDPQTGRRKLPDRRRTARRAARVGIARSGRAEQAGGTPQVRGEPGYGRHIQQNSVILNASLQHLVSPSSTDRLMAEPTLWLAPSWLICAIFPMEKANI